MSPGKTGSSPQDRTRRDLNWKLSTWQGITHTWMDCPPAYPKTHSYSNALTAVFKILWFLRIHSEKGNSKYIFNISDILFPVSICIDHNADCLHKQYIFMFEMSETRQLAGASL